MATNRFRSYQIVILALINWLQTVHSSEGTFSGHRLFRVVPADSSNVEMLQKLHYFPPDNLQHLDFWSEPSEPGDNVYILVHPNQEKDLEQFLRGSGIAFEIVVNDLQRILDEHSLKNLETRKDEEISVYDTYLTLDEAGAWLDKMVHYCDIRCSRHKIGRSSEGRNLTVVKVSSVSSTESTRKPAIWIDSGIHAREWIAPATALYFIDRLITDYDMDPETRYLVDKYDWYILPFVNPDGYHYSHVKNRLWRKTRSKASSSSSSSCVGVDANRNFGFHWKSVGYKDDPCSEIYPGREPFSEPETKALSDFVLSMNGTWKVFLTLHSYGQLWMAPYGYTTEKPEGYDNMMTAAAAAKRAIEDVYGTPYATGSASDVLYRSSGTSRDWAAGVPRIPFVYTIELRDKGQYGFLLPPEEILPTGIETWEGVKAMMMQIDRMERVDNLRYI